MSQITGTRDLAGNADKPGKSWKGLYRVGGAAALVATLMFLGDIVILAALGPIPNTAMDWFTLLQTNRAMGILKLFFTDVVGVALMLPFVLALYAALRQSHRAYATLAVLLAVAGIAMFLATNANYTLVYLSQQHAAAATEAQRALLLAAGETALAAGTWGTGPLMAGLLVEGAFLLISALMLRGVIFGRATAWIGIVAHGLDLAHAIAFLVLVLVLDTATALAVGTPLLVVGGTLQLIWYPLVGKRLLELGRGVVGIS